MTEIERKPTSIFRKLLEKLRMWHRRRTYREGKVVSRFIACDVCREILVISVARIDEGIITGRIKTSNLLYQNKGLVRSSEFEPAKELHIDEMWHWTGNDWGGLPDGTSIVDHLHERQSKTDQD